MLGKELEEKFGKPCGREPAGRGHQYRLEFGRESRAGRPHPADGTSTPMAINASLYKNLPFDPTADFVPLALVAQSPFVLIVEIVASGELGDGPDCARQGETWAAFVRLRRSGIAASSVRRVAREHDRHEMNHVTYRGSVPALNDVVAGHIDFMMSAISRRRAGMLQAGRVRPLGVCTAARIPHFRIFRRSTRRACRATTWRPGSWW